LNFSPCDVIEHINSYPFLDTDTSPYDDYDKAVEFSREILKLNEECKHSVKRALRLVPLEIQKDNFFFLEVI
jgi:hypothetical protein